MKLFLTIFTALLLIAANAYAQYEYVQNNDNAKYSLVENDSELYGISAGDMLFNAVMDASNIDTTLYEIIQNNNNAKYSLITNRDTITTSNGDILPGELQIPLIYIANPSGSSLDTSLIPKLAGYNIFTQINTYNDTTIFNLKTFFNDIFTSNDTALFTKWIQTDTIRNPSGTIDILSNSSHAIRVSGTETYFNTVSDAGDFKIQVNGNAYVSGGLSVGSVTLTGMQILSTEIRFPGGTGAYLVFNQNYLNNAVVPFRLEEITFTPTTTTVTSKNNGQVYIKNDYLIIIYNDGGTLKYRYMDLEDTTATWQYSTTEPS